MSLINQMLRDLEARRAAERRQQSGGLFSGLASGTSTTKGTRWLPRLFAVLITLLLVLVAFLAWQRFMVPTPSVATVQTPSPAKAEQALDTPTAHPQPALTLPTTVESPVQTTLTPPVETQPAREPAPPAPVTPTPAKPIVARSQSLEPALTGESGRIEKHLRPLSLSQQAEKAFQQGINRLREGNTASAESSLREALRLDNEHLQARETLGAMLLGAGRVIEAAEVLEAGRRFFARNPTLALLMARIQVEQSDLSGAITTLEQNLHAASARADYIAFLAALYQRALRFNDSIASYQRALGIETGQGSWWAGLAISLENAGRSADALKAYQRAAALALPPKLARYVQERLQVLAQ